MNIEKEYPFSNRQMWIDLVQNLWNLYTEGKLENIILSNGKYDIWVKDLNSYDEMLKAVLINRCSNISFRETEKSRYKTLYNYVYKGCKLTDKAFIIYRDGEQPLRIRR